MRVVTYKRTSTDHQEVENQTSSLDNQILENRARGQENNEMLNYVSFTDEQFVVQ